MFIKITDFVEFQNTEACIKGKEGDLSKKALRLRFNQIKTTKTKCVIQCTISRPLYNEMMRHNLERFKFYINEKTLEILIRLDTSSKCHNIQLHKLQNVGINIFDKNITYTFNEIFKEKGIKSLSYLAEYDDGLRLFLCKPIKQK